MFEQIFAAPHRDVVKRRAVLLFLIGLALCASNTRSLAQSNVENYEAERRRAFEIYDQGNFTAALPLFEKLAAANPTDVGVVERTGFLILAASAQLTDAEARKRERLRARTFLLRAWELGAHDYLLESVLEDMPADGGTDAVYSKRKEIDEAVREGEAAFAQGDYNKAVAAYERALKLDPKNYLAALFTGHAYSFLNQTDKASEWFARAISINSEPEQAYRYWGYMLMKQGKTTEARDKFVESFIHEPYSRLARTGLTQWAEKNGVALAHPKIDIPNNVSSSKPGEVTITIDALSLGKGKDETGSSAWMMYGMSRALWMSGKDGKLSEKFAKQYPNEKVYRHSLAEEMDALSLVVSMLKEQMKDGKKVKRLDPSLANLLKLSDAGLLEAYVLIARADQGIARDYPAYLKANPDKLRRYVVEYVLTGGGGAPATK
jgi:tetratricopeptide (TPR) repeat protein